MTVVNGSYNSSYDLPTQPRITEKPATTTTTPMSQMLAGNTASTNIGDDFTFSTTSSIKPEDLVPSDYEKELIQRKEAKAESDAQLAVRDKESKLESAKARRDAAKKAMDACCCGENKEWVYLGLRGKYEKAKAEYEKACLEVAEAERELNAARGAYISKYPDDAWKVQPR